MIKEAFVSFEVAKLLKEKGFVESCYGRYSVRSKDFHLDTTKPCNNGSNFLYSAPTHQMAMAWLREVHNIIIEPESVWNGKEWEYLLFVVTPQNADSPYYEHNPYKSYEECVEAALKYVLENLI